MLTLGRLRISGGRVPEFASADNPVARHPSRLTRGLTFLYLPAASVRMLLCPSTLSFDWSMDAIPRITSLRDSRNLQSVCLYAALGTATLWAVRRVRLSRGKVRSRSQTNYELSSYSMSATSWFPISRCPVCAGRRTGSCHTDGCRAANNNNGPVNECHCLKKKVNHGYSCSAPSALLVILGFLVLPFLPASNLFFYVGFVIAERILYLPSVGACLAIGAAISGTHGIAKKAGCGKLSKGIIVATTLFLGLMSARTLLRNMDWYGEESLYRSALRVNPPKGKIYFPFNILITHGKVLVSC